jgi:hypothetical protein
MLTLNYKYLAHGNKFVFQAFVGRGVGMRELGAILNDIAVKMG